MVFFRRWLLIGCALVLSSGPIFAGNSKDDRAYAAAVSAFQDEMWSRAETQLAQFILKFPDSTNVPQARLLQAQAELKQQAFADAIGLLQTNLPDAGALADQYVYWTGEAQFQKGDFSGAAETFVSLAKKYPDSPLRLRAVVEAAAAFANLDKWEQTVASLQEKNGAFQSALQLDPGNELVTRGELLLAQAKFALKDFGGASTALDAINPQAISSALDWQRIYLLCQVKLAAGEMGRRPRGLDEPAPAARRDHVADLATNLPATMAMRAGILEKLGRTDEALAVYRENLTNGAPVELQQQAILKTAGLAAALGQFSDATNALGNFLVQFSNSPAADLALLTLGELQLKAHMAESADSNQLASAQASFDQFLTTFTNSPLTGKAHLDRGWCFWLAAKFRRAGPISSWRWNICRARRTWQWPASSWATRCSN